MALKDFYQGTTKKFDIQITYNGITPDISADEMMFYLKDNKDDSIYTLTASADVSTSGSVGIAKFHISSSLTEDLNPEIYNYKIQWNLNSGESYILEQNTVNILQTI